MSIDLQKPIDSKSLYRITDFRVQLVKTYSWDKEEEDYYKGSIKLADEKGTEFKFDINPNITSEIIKLIHPEIAYHSKTLINDLMLVLNRQKQR